MQKIYLRAFVYHKFVITFDVNIVFAAYVLGEFILK